VPLPGWEDNPHKKIYVWFDAVIGYLSASIEWAAARGEPDSWKDWWQNDDAWHYYVMGKDNITFHTVLWPAILMGSGDLELPDEIVASEYLNMGGKKFSTSRGQVIYVRDVLERYDADALRYYLMIAGPENQDTDFTWSEFVRRNNDELVATWGNLVHRTLVNAHRNFGAVPQPQSLTEADQALIDEIEGALGQVASQLGEARFQGALKYAMTMAARVNVYLGTEQPWHTIKTDRDRAGLRRSQPGLCCRRPRPSSSGWMKCPKRSRRHLRRHASPSRGAGRSRRGGGGSDQRGSHAHDRDGGRP
jgi:methionyl-tRNA synthetase